MEGLGYFVCDRDDRGDDPDPDPDRDSVDRRPRCLTFKEPGRLVDCKWGRRSRATDRGAQARGPEDLREIPWHAAKESHHVELGKGSPLTRGGGTPGVVNPGVGPKETG